MWWMACVSNPDVAVETDEVPPRETGDDPGISTVDTPGSVETLPGAAPEAGACSDLFDPDTVTRFAMELPDTTLSALAVDYQNGLKDYHPGVLVRGDEQVDVKVRLKGNPSFSWFQSKMQFVVSFNEDDPEGRFHGLRKIAFDAPWYDASMLRDRLAWSILGEVGAVPGTCTATVALDINGSPYGAYTLIEYFDHEWLERNFGDDGATGTLWKYGTEPVANEEAADGDAIAALQAADTYRDLQAAGPVEQWAAAWAGEAALGDDDGYWCCAHNYYLYEHPTDGLLFVVWDLDDALDVMPYDADPVDGYPQSWGLFSQRPFGLLTENPEGRALYREALADVRAAMDPDVIAARIDAWGEAMAEVVAEDPMRPYTAEEHDEARERLKTWIAARSAYLDAWLACDAGTADDGDGDGSDDCADPDDADPAIHPGAAELCDGRDQDANGIIDDDLRCDDCIDRSFEGRRYSFCRTPRTYAEAEARCGEMGLPTFVAGEDADTYYLYFYAWPVQDPWYVHASSPGHCRAWDTMSVGYTSVDCDEPHPTVCGGG